MHQPWSLSLSPCFQCLQQRSTSMRTSSKKLLSRRCSASVCLTIHLLLNTRTSTASLPIRTPVFSPCWLRLVLSHIKCLLSTWNSGPGRPRSLLPIRPLDASSQLSRLACCQHGGAAQAQISYLSIFFNICHNICHLCLGSGPTTVSPQHLTLLSTSQSSQGVTLV